MYPPRNRRRALLLEADAKGKLRDVRQVAVDDEAPRPSPVELSPLLGELPQNAALLALACAAVGTVEGYDEQSSTVLLYDCDRGTIVGHEGVLGDPVAALGELVTKTFSGEAEVGDFRGRPARVVFESRRLHDALGEALEGIGVAADLELDHPAFAAIDLIFEGFLGGGGDDDDEFAEIPESCETLEEWHRADILVTREFRDWIFEQAGDAFMPDLFGVDSIEGVLSDAPTELAAHLAYVDWLYLDQRTEGSDTQVEEDLAMLEADDDDDADAEEVILKALRDSWVSLFRVKESGGEVFRVVDLRDLEEYTVHQEAVSRILEPGLCLFLRMYHVDEWTFSRMVGPVIPQHRVHRVLEQMENASRSGPRTEHFRDRMSAIGRLWVEEAMAAGEMPEMVTSDGDPLEPIKATFSVKKVDRLLAALAKREDLDSPEDQVWVWLNEENTVLGNLELLGHELLVEVFSRNRLDHAREWLEAIPGVKFVRERAVDFASTAARRGVVPPPREEIPPEVLATLAPVFEEKLRGWLDEKVPALDGKTPREAVKDPALRERAAQILRSMDDPTRMMPGPSIIDFDAIRRSMMDELGLT